MSFSKFLTRQGVYRRVLLAALHSALFLIIRQLVPSAEEVSLLIFAVGILFSLLLVERISLVIAGIAVTAVIHIFFYERISGLDFNLHQLVQNPLEAGLSVIFTLGNTKAVLVVVEFATSILIFAWTFRWILGRFQVARAVWPALVLFLFAAPVGAKLSFFYLSPVAGVDVRFEGNQEDLPTDNQSLFMLQLESVNGPVLHEAHLDLPGEKKAHEMGGSTIPYFWASTFGTNLGFSSILCGTSGALTFRLVRPQDGRPCLPERFKRAGFETAYYYSYKASDFYQMEEHVSQMGFEKFIYGEQLMVKSDPFYGWGYDDCRFFDRAFADMKKSGLDRRKKIFVYFSVHMNHAPFENHLQIEHPFENPKSTNEIYLNSAFEQDYCMGKFLDHVRALHRDDINVVISGDHGFPAKHRHELYDRYMTRVQFIPSQKNKKKYPSKILEDFSPAQDQIQATVLELFGAPHRSASFLWALEGKPKPENYRDCILIADRTSSSVYAIHGDEAVRKFTVLNTFEKVVYQSRQLKETIPLDRISSWQAVQMPADCLQRLGAPKFN